MTCIGKGPWGSDQRISLCEWVIVLGETKVISHDFRSASFWLHSKE